MKIYNVKSMKLFVINNTIIIVTILLIDETNYKDLWKYKNP